MGTRNRFQQVRVKYRFSYHTQLRIAESTNKHTVVSPAPFSLARSTAWPRAVLCRALQCFLFRTYQTTTLAICSKHTELTRASMYVLDHFIQLPSSFPFFFHLFLMLYPYVYSKSSTCSSIICTAMYVVELLAQHNKAQSPLHKIQRANVPIRVRTKRSMYI